MLSNTLIVAVTLTIEALFFLALLANHFYKKKNKSDSGTFKADEMMIAFKVLAKSKLNRAIEQVKHNEIPVVKEESRKWVLSELEDLKKRRLFSEKEYHEYKDEMAAYN